MHNHHLYSKRDNFDQEQGLKGSSTRKEEVPFYTVLGFEMTLSGPFHISIVKFVV